MPTVLWVSARPPGFTGGGGAIRQAHLVAAAASIADVHLLLAGPLTDDAVRRHVASVTTVEVPTPTAPRARRLHEVRLMLPGAPPVEVAEHAPHRLALAGPLRRLLDDVGPDLVCVEYLGLAPLIAERGGSGRWQLTLHNLPSVMESQHAVAVGNGRRAVYHRRLASVSRRFERQVAQRYDRVVTVTDEDRVALGADVPTAVVPNGVDLDEFAVSARPACGGVLFTGALDTAPNVDGVSWFIRDVLPLVRAAGADEDLTVVGADPTPAIRRLATGDGVVLHADVPSPLPYLHRARVAVVPLRIGSGSRLKALEAFAAGRPVVGTTIGLEGLGVENGRHALVADDPATFAAAVVRLLRDDSLAEDLTAAARRLVEERYGWGSIGDNYLDLVREA